MSHSAKVRQAASPTGRKPGSPTRLARLQTGHLQRTAIKTFDTYVLGGFAGTHEIAEILYECATNFDVHSASIAKVLLNDREGDEKDLEAFVDGLVAGEKAEDKALHAYLTKLPPISDERMDWHRMKLNEWHDAVLRAAYEGRWQRFDLVFIRINLSKYHVFVFP